MSDIEFSKAEKEILSEKLQTYFRAEHDLDLGRFGAEFLLKFLSTEIGPYYYNRGLYDARAVLSGKMEDITEAIYEIEKPTQIGR